MLGERCSVGVVCDISWREEKRVGERIRGDKKRKHTVLSVAPHESSPEGRSDDPPECWSNAVLILHPFFFFLSSSVMMTYQFISPLHSSLLTLPSAYLK